VSAQNNGGPAFPVDTGSTGDVEYGDFGHQTGNTTWQFPGMTLRDYFAAKAMPTMISMCQYADGAWDHATVAQNAYALADAMLAERAEVQS
jgi:hypothetical protein